MNLPWGQDISRVDLAVGYRFTSDLQLKVQYSVQSERWADADFQHTISAQLTFRF